MFGRIAGSSTRRMRSPSSCRARRRPRACESGTCARPSRVAPTISGSASTAMMMPAGEERAPVDRAVRRALGEEAEEALREDEQAEDREHDARHAADRLDRRLDRARERPRPAVLGQPRGDRHADRRRRSRCRSPSAMNVPDDRIEEAAGFALADRWRRRLHEQTRLQVGDPLDEHEQDDPERDRHSATPVAQHSQ